MPPKAKRRKLDVKAVEEIAFDTDARQEYLSGFHKRKLERAKHARDIAEKKARAEKLAERKRLREERRTDLERHIQEVNALVGIEAEASFGTGAQTDDSTDEEFNGFEDPPIPVDHESEYIDEDRYTTVTVEEMDLSKEGIYKAEQAAEEEEVDSAEKHDEVKGTAKAGNEPGKKIWTKQKPADGEKRPKQKKKKFRYESKAERKFTRAKEKSKNSKQAKARREK